IEFDLVQVEVVVVVDFLVVFLVVVVLVHFVVGLDYG
ncbi:hypothetical protein A2U01_0061273, partial [Trifolium medium]|nr:hypothetical protein [Trifolium medium]